MKWAMPRRHLIVFALVSLASSALAAPAYVRVDQLGYAPGTMARAYLVASASDAATHFTIGDANGAITFTGPVGTSTGRWAAYTIYPLDFPAGAAGTYTITVKGAVHASSIIHVANPATLYGGALSNARAFFQNQRDGADFIVSALRNAAAHVNDSSASVYETPTVNSAGLVVGNLVPTGDKVDAGGGWWDAGDYLKFVETHSYTVAMLLTGLRDFPSQLGPNGPADLTAEAKFGLAWLLKMWNDPARTLTYQVGIGSDFQGRSLLSDHDLWRLPQLDDTLGAGNPNYALINHRPVFRAGPSGALISPNLAGRLSAAFALGFIAFRHSDATFAGSCLVAAEHIFDLANTRPTKLLTTLPYDFYPETEWRDDLEWGATELNLALAIGGDSIPASLPHSSAAYYLAQATHWAHAYIAGPNDAADTLNLYDVSFLAHGDLVRAIDFAGRPAGSAATRADVLADMLRQLTKAASRGRADPFGFGFPWATYDTTSHGAGLSVMASEYAFLTGDARWTNDATLWLGNIMGENIWGLSLIAGDGTTFPKCLQHQVANIAGSLNGTGSILAGAAVEGPNATGAVAHGFLQGMRRCPANGLDPYRGFTGRGARFRDSQQNYANTEPAIDLTASSPLMFAWRIAGAPQPFASAR